MLNVINLRHFEHQDLWSNLPKVKNLKTDELKRKADGRELKDCIVQSVSSDFQSVLVCLQKLLSLQHFAILLSVYYSIVSSIK